MSFQYTRDNRVKVWVDGCFQSFPRLRGGFGVWFNDNHAKNEGRAVHDLAGRDNNDMELLAAQRAINIIAGPCLVYTDSQYVMDNLHKIKTHGPGVTFQRASQEDSYGISKADQLARQGAQI